MLGDVSKVLLFPGSCRAGDVDVWGSACPSVADPKPHLPAAARVVQRQRWQTWCHHMMTCAFYRVNTVFLLWAGFLSKDTFLWTECADPVFLVTELLQGVFVVVSQPLWKASVCRRWCEETQHWIKSCLLQDYSSFHLKLYKKTKDQHICGD